MPLKEEFYKIESEGISIDYLNGYEILRMEEEFNQYAFHVMRDNSPKCKNSTQAICNPLIQ